ncbi:dihydroxyacetone kinase subunit DhaL [Streptococcus sobrinus]|uniref:dihydroxyacetone kinase subunit DhaL n=1 Tax=Streptococcus sobrinus TaxID=1310 RepID=UPI0002DBC6F7|nr:dihydroxyacetone kinase subunit DhaL [Streptococcus sobrinus]
MDIKIAKAWMTSFNDKIQENKDYLSELDTPIGDGDHGSNMARGMAAVMEALDQSEPATTADLFKLVSMQLLSKVGGASGPLYGSAFMGMTKAEQAGVDLPGLIEAGLEMIQKRGKATTNEKTMVDVWAGVLDALKENKLNAAVIDQLVQASKDMKAIKGRASYVGERSIGHIDPGSSSSGLLFKALLEVGGA